MDSKSVEIKVECCGLCGSDDHLIVGDYGDFAQFPLVCGHEVVGRVTKIGEEVKTLKVDDRVGVGWQLSSCGDCEQCDDGDEQLCEKGFCFCLFFLYVFEFLSFS